MVLYVEYQNVISPFFQITVNTLVVSHSGFNWKLPMWFWLPPGWVNLFVCFFNLLSYKDNSSMSILQDNQLVWDTISIYIYIYHLSIYIYIYLQSFKCDMPGESCLYKLLDRKQAAIKEPSKCWILLNGICDHKCCKSWREAVRV